MIHCGDFIGAQTVVPLEAAGLPVDLVHGNNVGDPMALHNMARDSDGLIAYQGGDARIEIGGRRIFVVHCPDYGYAMAGTGDWDVVCCGHLHEADVRRVANVRGGETWLTNPGTVAGLAALRFDVHRAAL